jgi:hypothetical protein
LAILLTSVVPTVVSCKFDGFCFAQQDDFAPFELYFERAVVSLPLKVSEELN